MTGTLPRRGQLAYLESIGKSDAEIAERFNITAERVAARRAELWPNRPAAVASPSPAAANEPERPKGPAQRSSVPTLSIIHRLRGEGMLDHDIGARFGMSGPEIRDTWTRLLAIERARRQAEYRQAVEAGRISAGETMSGWPRVTHGTPEAQRQLYRGRRYDAGGRLPLPRLVASGA